MPNRLSEAEIAQLIIANFPCMVAYWDASETCRFANHSYQLWFGKSPSELIGTTLENLLGPLYKLNLPYIQGVLLGEPQVFERRIPLPDGTGFRDSLAVYTPDIADGVVRGFVVQVSDITFATQQAGKIRTTLKEPADPSREGHSGRDVRTLCAWCKQVQNAPETWMSIEAFVSACTGVIFSHGICPTCYQHNSALP